MQTNICKSKILRLLTMAGVITFCPMVASGQSYTISQSGTYSIEIDNPTYITANGDEITQIPIGFNFEFFGNPYSDCYVGGDGFITFSADPYTYCCGQQLPDPDGPNNLIAAAWSNMDFVSVHYELFGNAPYRRLVVTFDLGNPCDSSYYGQVKLFETTNIIEIHTQQWYGGECQGWTVTQGIENATGSLALAVPGRNYNDTWQVLPGDNDFVSFQPIEEPLYIVEHNTNCNLQFQSPSDITLFDNEIAQIPIGFDFTFFGYDFNQCYVSDNGFVSFDSGVGSGCCSGQDIPDPNNPGNLIALAWMDAGSGLCCSGGNNYNTVQYETIGAAPDRIFLITYYMPEACGQYYHGQLKLFETSNIIEIHTDYWADSGQPCSNVTQGIENSSGTTAYYYQGRNANTSWNVPCCSNDVVRFIPSTALPQADAGVSNITNDPFCEGPQLMSLFVRNFGGHAIDSVKVHWTWDNVLQDSLDLIIHISTGDTLFYIPLDTQNLVFGQSYELTAWTSMPNGVPDENPVNDTMTATITVGMHGNFTIGGSNPDFTSIQEAVDSLQSVGICDTVIMQIRPGTYTEQVTIPYIPGVFGKEILFTSESGDSSSVQLQFDADTSSGNYVLGFNNAFNIIWEKMTLNALGDISGRVIQLTTYSINNTIRHCAINGRNTTSTSTDYACIFSRSYNHNTHIENNTTTNGSYGFFHDIVPETPIGIMENNPFTRGGGGGGNTNVNDIRLTGNAFLQFSRRGIQTYNTNGIEIDHNRIETTRANVWGIQLYSDLDTLTLSNNLLYLPAGNIGIHLTNVNPTDGSRARIFNNMVNVPNTSGANNVGVGLYNCSETNIYHNTIRLNQSSVNSFAFYHSGGGLDSIYNNIFSNTGSGPTIYIIANNTNRYNYNNFHFTGSLLGTFGSTQYNAEDLEQWRSLTGTDQQSIATDPLFLASSDLHVRASLLNAAGYGSLSSMADIDGTSRNATYPDIGADEFDPVSVDASILELLSPTLTCDAEQYIEVVLANLGTDTLDTATIQWSLNGIPQSDFAYSGSLAPEGDTAHLVIGIHNFSSFQSDSLRIWVSMPNNTNDLQPENDTLGSRFRLPLSGVYTIGGSSPDFTTISLAVAAINQFHTCGPVIFRIRDGVYTEQIILDSIPTTSVANTITFESESLDSNAVTIQYTPQNNTRPYVILLSGTDHVTFRHLGIKALPSSYSDVLELRYGADNTTVSHCILEGYHFSSSSILIKCLNYGGISDSLTVTQNYFLNGQQAIYLYNGGNKQNEILIDGNRFVNQRYTSLDLGFIRRLYVRDNIFTSNTTYSSFKAIDLSSSEIYTEVSGNNIVLDNTGDGMFLDGMNYGTNPGITYIYNNMVKSAGSGSGIRIWNSENTLVNYNNCNLTGNGAAFELVGGDSANVRNNIFVSNSGRAFSSFSFTPTVTSDYNDLLSTTGDLGYWHDTLYSTFAEWQLGTGFDSNSISIDPQFVSPTDLHILADTLDGAGIPIAGLTIDFDGNPRNAISPDIGADEIGANDDDAGVFAILPEMPFARGDQEVKAVIRNYGGNTITSLGVQWELNNIPQPAFNYTGTLTSLQQDTVILGTVEFLLATPYILKAWTSEPNGNPDYYTSNDTLLTGNRYPAVSDTVTIAGTNPDVPNIAAALTALSLGGVLDSVHFQLRNGTYHSILILPQSIGMNCTTPIIFESESGNPADVTWDNLNLAGHTVVLDGADGVTFKNLTLKTLQSAYHAVEFKNGANCNTFESCIIEGVVTTSTSTSQATIFSNGAQNNNNTFTGNTIKNGSYGLFWDGAYTTTGANVSDNEFVNAYYTSLTLSRHTAPIAVHNTLSTNSTYYYIYGIHLNECSLNTNLSDNQVLLEGKRGVGILLSSSTGTNTQSGIIANNFIIIGNSASSVGIQHHYCNWTKIYHNTIRITGGGSSGIAFYRSYATNADIKNNIFDNRAGGVAMYIGSNEGPLASDHNDLYSTGTYLVHYAGTNYYDLQAWQATGFDTNSVSADPMYLTGNGYTVTSAAINAKGIPLTLVTEDIEQDDRDPITPDPGCDEFMLASDDVGILAINNPTEPFPSGVNTVFIKFVNNGQDTLTSMQVDWEVDSIAQPTYIWTGILPSGGTYDSLDIGTYDFSAYDMHSIRVWVSQPNGVADGLALNDTLVVDSLYPGLSGTYTIGGANPDFDSLGTAVNHLNLGGAAGPVTFNIRTGTYPETLTIYDYPGSDCNRPVIFKSESGDSTDVIINNLGIDDNVITLNGADGVIFRDLTLQSVNTAYRNVVEYFNGAHCNQFLNNHIAGYEANSTNQADAVILSNSSLDTANVFANNWIEHGSIAFYLGGNGALSNTTIQNNFLDNNYYHGIYATSESAISIMDNVITGSTAPYYRGIYLEYCHGANRIERNDIRCQSSENILRLESCIGAGGERAKIINNFLSSTGTSGTNGLLINNCKRYDVFNNNLYLNSTIGSTGMYFHTDSSLHLANNIIINAGVGQAIYGNNQTAFTSDYNNLQAAGATGTWNGVGVPNLTAWQVATGQDTHSLSINPQYMSSSNLHVSNILLNGAGITLAGVANDIDGDSRTNPPDIGADEFDPSIANDAGVFMYVGPNAPFAYGSQPITIALKNYGFTTLTSADVRWVVNGFEQPVYHWTGSLPSAQCDTIVIGNYSFAEYSDHDFILWTEMPNGVQDSTHVNDTLIVDDQYPALSGTYTVGGVLPDFNLFSQLQQALNKGGILGDVTFNIREGIYTTQLLIEDFPRANYAHQIIFQSEARDSSLVNIKRNFPQANNYTISLADAHNIIFRDLTLSSTQGRIVEITDQASKIEISHCRFKGVDIGYVSGSHQLIYSNTSTEDTIYIHHNRFEEGDYGVYLTASGGDPEKEVSIENNDFYNTRYRSIYTQFHDGLKVSDNHVFVNQTDHEGIVITSSANTKKINSNDIRLLAGGNAGLYLLGVSGTAGLPAEVSNNYIYISGWPYASHGIYQAYCNYLEVDFNTVRLESTGPGSIGFTDENSNQNIHLRNNNFANYSDGLSMYVNWQSPYTSNTTDYCNLYTTGATLARYGSEYTTLATLQTSTGQNIHGMNAEPLFASEDPDVFQAALDSAAIPVAGITADINGVTRNALTPDVGCKEFTLLSHDIGAKLLVTPETYCGLSNAETVSIRIQNYGTSTETGFDVAYTVNGSGWMVQNVGSLSIAPGGTADFSFTQTADLGTIGTYLFAFRTSMGTDLNTSNDTIWNEAVEHIPALMQPVSNMIPMDGATGIEKPVSLSWNPAPNATLYDLYVWPSSGSQPVDPTQSNLVTINTSENSVEYGTTYSWRVIAKNTCNQTQASPIQQFTVRELPDLVVDSISAPLMAVSEQQIQIEWQVKNTGTGSTQSSLWTDAVYLSQDATLNTSFDTYLGGVQNLTSLQPDESYLQTGTFTIPQGFTGNYYVFVYADAYSGVIESINTNNWARTATQMEITLLPPPDLVIDQVVTPATAFSGSSISVHYTGRNNGIGDTGNGSWKDRIKISEDGSSSAGGITLATITINGPLEVDSTYERTLNVNLPNAIFGAYYIYVETDILNQVYEQAAENNNYGRSDTMEIILTPPPNLVGTVLNLPDTLHSNANTSFNWTVENQGGSSPPEPYWFDVLYLSPSPVYNTNFLTTLLTSAKYSPLNPGATYSPMVTSRLPVVNEGSYYIYTYTDRYNNVFEHTFENDNITRFGPYTIVNPDIEPIIGVVPDTAQSGDIIPVNWQLVNHGPGHMYDRSLRYSYYVSTDTTFDAENAILARTTNTGNLNLLSEDTLTIQTTITLPPGLNDHYYLYILVEPQSVMHEQGDAYANNVGRSMGYIDIDPGPYADLTSISIVTPDTATAGDNILVSYTQINQGGAIAAVRGTEAIYLSFSPVWNISFAQLISEATYTLPLEEDSSIVVNRSIVIPATTTTNVYYIYVVTDKNNIVFEYLGENNNIMRSDPVFINPYPPVDIAVSDIQLSQDTLQSGASYPVSYLVHNLEASPLRNLWRDAIYLSADSIFNPQLDILVSVYDISTPGLMEDDTFPVTVSAMIPNGISGDYYVFVKADIEDINDDINPLNNINLLRSPGGQAIQKHITLSPFPDLVVSVVNAPASAIAGQQYTVAYTIENLGNTTATSWQDRIYLSGDAVISNGDLLMYSGRINQTVAPLNMVSDTFTFDLPGYLNGNYYMIVKTDYLNELYEHTGESNNQTTLIIQVTSPPPSDLIVDVISIPDSLLAGDQTTISWTTKNHGSFPAQGSVREIVYLSSDTLWNVEDQVFGTRQSPLYLPPQSSHTDSVTAPVTGVINQDYYALVRTDALSNINESNDTNNISASFDPAFIDVKTLYLDSLTTDSLHTGEELYYKLSIDPGHAGESILVTLDGDSTHTYNELFISFNDAPTRADFDISNNKPLSGKQQAVITNAQAGTYYILGFGATDTGEDQEVTLLARVLSYEILAVAPERGSNTGMVTMVIDGSRLDSTYAVRLHKLDSAGFVLLADTFIIVSPEKIIARFDLRGVVPGFYNVECQIEPYYIAVLENGFEVFEGSDADLQVNWYLSPGGTSPRNKPVKIVVEMINNGDTDAENKYIRIYSPYGNLLSWTYDDLYAGITYPFIDIPVQLQSGYEGILPPGNSAMYEVFSWLQPYPFFILAVK